MGFTFAQQYMGVSVDNDLYFGIDRYYTSGIFLKYGKVINTSIDSTDPWKYKSRHWTLGQEINTPSLRLTKDLAKMDYPYNGWLYIRFEQAHFQHPDLGYSWGFQIGATGAEKSFAKFMQNTYHTYILNLEELSWSFSIPQAYHLNFHTNLMWGKPLNKKFKFVQENQVQLGTFRTSLKTRIGFQMGSMKGLPFFGQRLEELSNGFSTFLGAAFEYNIHDYSLSGSFINDNSPFDFKPYHLRNDLQGGIMFFKKPWQIKALIHSSSRSISTQKFRRHPYLNITLSRVF